MATERKREREKEKEREKVREDRLDKMSSLMFLVCQHHLLQMN